MKTRAFHSLLAVLITACVGPVGVGEPCRDSSECPGDHSCIASPSASGTVDCAVDVCLCMAECDTTMTWICEDGLVCLPTQRVGRPPELGTCHLGGDIAVGDSCVGRRLACAAGSACIVFEAGVNEVCHRACTVGDATGCDSGETCVMLAEGSTNGYCQPPP